MFLGKPELPPPADVGWSINKSGISGIGRHQLEYELQKILSVGWGINYISHCYPLCAYTRPEFKGIRKGQLGTLLNPLLEVHPVLAHDVIHY